VGDLERERLRAAMDLVDELFDLPEGEREAVLERAEPEVRADARRLLEADARKDGLLSGPLGALLPSALKSFEPSDRSRGAHEGTAVGPFRLVRRLGEGGMGEVWVAERTGADFRQDVAIKLLHVRGDAAATAARFRLERRILARLSHPRIARLLDGGTTEDGRPWLAMELVEGLSLTEHCATRSLAVEDRLRLFAEVCDAVQFAHRNLVVHRDLKPSNILVDGNGEPKLLDFGIAKLLQEDDDDSPATLTRTGERPMTPDYAAPEQVLGEAVTTATDVWGLGVILHELLTGARPFVGSHGSAGAVERSIVEAAPTKPSSNAAGKALRRRLKGDLDAIVLKALRRRPEERYPSAEALASDVRRHLDGLPVTARGETASYLLRSFVRRYRAAVSVSALGLAVVLAGLVGTLWQAHRAREEARKAEQVQEFLLALLQSFDPLEQGGRPVDERDILVRGEERLPRELGDRPDVQAKLWRAFGRTWFNMGAYDRAKPAAEHALALERTVLGPRSDEEAQTLLLLGDIAGVQRADLGEADRAYADACSILRETRGRDDLVAVNACASDSGIKRIEGEFPAAEKLSSEYVATVRRVLGERAPDTLDGICNHALLLGEWGRLDEAVDIYRRTNPILSEVEGAKHPNALWARHNLARFLLDLGNAEEAETILREVEADMVLVYGEDYGQLALAWRTHARALDALGRSDEAVALLDRSIERWTRVVGARSDQVASSMEARAIALRHLGKLHEAEAAARQSLDLHVALAGDNFVAARTRSVLGSVLLDEGRTEQAREELSRALTVQEQVLWPGHPYAVTTRAELARAEAAMARHE
jgi:serine/threonine protein kinase